MWQGRRKLLMELVCDRVRAQHAIVWRCGGVGGVYGTPSQAHGAAWRCTAAGALPSALSLTKAGARHRGEPEPASSGLLMLLCLWSSNALACSV